MTQMITPPFTEQTARTTVQAVENAWNTRQTGMVTLNQTHTLEGEHHV